MGKHMALGANTKCVLVRKGDYRGTCGGFPNRRTPWPNQIHHIVCEHAVTDFDVPADKFDYLKKCLRASDWDVNEKPNLVGLPLRSTYTDPRRKDENKPWKQNLVCHTVDHPLYTQEVKDYLHDNIWNKLRIKQKNHDVEAEKIKKQLQDCAKTFRKRLESRGQRNGGTKYSWYNREKPSERRKWYKPFSMAAKPRPRNPTKTPSASVFALLDKIR